MDKRIARILAAGLTALVGTACGDDGAGGAETGSTGTAGPTSTTLPPTTSTQTVTDTTPTSSTTADTTADGSSTTGMGATLLERVIEAIGGEANFDALDSFELAVTGSKAFPDEGFTPGGPPAVGNDFTNTVTYEIPSGSLLVDASRTITFEGLGVPQMFTEIVQDDLGHIDGIESLFGAPTGDLASDRWAAITREQKLLNPHLLLVEVLADPSTAQEAGEQDYDGRPHELLEIEHPVAPITLWVDSGTDLISRLTTMENHYLRRDVEIDVIYTDWDAATDVLFPTQVEILVDGEVVHDETRSGVTINPAIAAGTFDFPAGAAPVFDQAAADRGERNHQWHRTFAGVGIAQSGVQTFIAATELDPGVHWLAGGSHHSMVIEQANGVVVVEAPLYEARCVAILDWIDTNIPGATTTHVVTSHFHQDHTGCVRTFVARGATVVVGAGAEGMWDTILAAPSTIEPDELEASPVASPTIEVVPNAGSFLLDDAVHPVVIYDLETEHSDDMVLPFVESTGAAFVVDLYNPGNGGSTVIAAGPQEILDALATHGITGDVNQLVGGHGGVSDLAELQAFVAP